MPDSSDVTLWIVQLKAGEPAAAQPLWEKYFAQLVALARTRLRGTLRKVVDEEDVALSAFDSFCRGAGEGRFPKLNDRDDLWQLLVVIANRKAVNQVRYENRVKRKEPPRIAATDSNDPLTQAPGLEPTPEFAAEVAEECRRLLELLDVGEQRQIAIWKMEGCTNAEIALRISRSVGTVERKLALIRKRWEREMAS